MNRDWLITENAELRAELLALYAENENLRTDRYVSELSVARLRAENGVENIDDGEFGYISPADLRIEAYALVNANLALGDELVALRAKYNELLDALRDVHIQRDTHNAAVLVEFLTLQAECAMLQHQAL